MPGLLSALKDVANRQTYEGIQLHLVPRGLIYPIDFGGLGQVRFGQKEGSQLPLIRPDNRFLLDEDAPFGTDFVVLQIIPTWLQPGGYLTVGEKETHQIDDVNDNIVFFTDRLASDYDAGQFCYHYSNPVEVEGNYSKDQLVINVDSPYFMVRGDVLAIPTEGSTFLTFFKEYMVNDLTLVSVVNDVYQYQVTLDSPLTRALEDGETIQIRSYPAYKSNIRNVTSDPGSLRRIAGPFLLDWVSAPLRNKLSVSETQTVYLYTNNRTLLEPPRVVEKNATVLGNPVLPEQFLFWQKVEGSISYDNGLSRFVMLPNSKGHWRLKYECIPLIEVPVRNATGFIQCVAPSDLSNNEYFILDDSDVVTQFEFQINAGYIPTPSSAATGLIDVATIPSDNQWITIDDGFGGVVDFEFQRTAGYTKTSGRYTVDIRSAVIPTDVAILIREFLENIIGFQITPTTSGTQVNLTHNKVSTKGNQPIVWDAGLVGWTFSGMSGGTIKVVTLDVQTLTTALEVAQLVSSTITNEQLLVTASYPGLIPVVELGSTVPGPTANIPIVSAVAALGWSVGGMSGGSGGFKWTVSLKPEVDSLFRIRFYPNDWQTFNLTGGVEQTIDIVINATDEPIEMIDMLCRSDPNTEILMGQWNITGSRVGAIHYEYVARVQGDYNFSCTTLFLKPLWQHLGQLRAYHDINAALDHGYVRL